MGDLDVTIDVTGINDAFAALMRHDFPRTFAKLRKPLHEDQRAHAHAESGPQMKWRPLAKSTVEHYARTGRGGANRRLLAKLPSARRTLVNARKLVMYSPIRWAAAHQDGPARTGRGGRSLIPQRQYLWISKEFMKLAGQSFADALYRRWKSMGGR